MLNNPNNYPILNLGSGGSKIKNSVSFDSSSETNPDVIGSLIEPLPFENNSFDKVLLFHCIEHIQKCYHNNVLSEIWRVLKPNGIFLCAYPEFGKIAQMWIDNYNGDRDKWEHVIYGRQLYPGDFHVCAMDTIGFKEVLLDNGFNPIESIPEPKEPFNTVIKSSKIEKPVQYEEVLYKEVFS